MGIVTEIQDVIDLLNGPGSPVDYIVYDENIYEAVESLIDKHNELQCLLEQVQDIIA